MVTERSDNNKPSSLPAFQNVSENPVIVGLQGPLEGKKWDVIGELIIGREQDCDIAIVDRQVSRLHARLTNLGNNRIQLDDLGSKNGTYLKGELLKKSKILEDGDVIQIALIQKFTFYLSDATMPLEDLLPQGQLNLKRIILDAKSRRVWIKGKELLPPLSLPQFRLLYALSQQAGKVISRNELVQTVWQEEESEGISEQAVDALIRRLRGRLAEVDPGFEYLVTVRGHGLRLDE
jgi:DNA-binding winged helix-turn-helix (wHTH) protein